MSTYSIIAALIVTGAISYVVARVISSTFHKHGIGGVDVHKTNRPLRSEMGGLAILVAAPIGSGVFLALDANVTNLFFVGLVTIVLVGLIGVLDDLVGMRQRYKPFLVAAASFPLAYFLLDKTSVIFPIVGSVNFGLLYPILVVPLAIATSANLTNMLAGFNGLEAGCAVIALGTMSGLAALKQSWNAAYLALIFAVAFVGFLKMNWYPAKLFPGDTGTLMAGAAIATVGLIGGLEFVAVVLSMPAALDFTLKMMTRNPFGARGKFGDTKVGADGVLHPPNYASLSHAFMKVAPTTERGLVSSLMLLECMFALLAVITTTGIL